MVKSLSLTSAQINALTTGNNTILYNNQTRDLVLYSGSVIQSSIYNLEINNLNGQCLVLRRNSSETNYVNFDIANDGKLDIKINGSNKLFNIVNHNGTTSGLALNGTLITASASDLNKIADIAATSTELNYVNTTPGIAAANKAIVLDSNKDISGIRNLQTDNLTVNGTLITASATEINYNDIATIGTAEAGKALIVDVNKDISNIRNISATNVSATNLTGTLQTSAQTNITSVGTLSNLIVSGNTNISGHNGSTSGLQLNGILVTATASELNILDGITATTAELNILDGITSTTSELNYNAGIVPGTASASKVIVLDANKDISGIRNLQTENLTVNGTLITASAAEINYNDITTIGTAEAGKALVIDANKDISGIRNLSANSISATNLTGSLQTASQTNITSIGTLSSLSVSGNVNISGHNGTTTGLQLSGALVTATAAELNKLDGLLASTDELNLLNGLTTSTNELNILDGITATTAELNVLDGITAATAELNLLDGVTATTAELNYVDTTAGTVEASKAIIVDSNKDTTGIRNLTATSVSATNLTGTLQTAAQTNVTSVGTLSSLTVSGNTNISGHNGTTTGLQLNGALVTATAIELNLLDGVTATTAELNYVDTTAGTVEASKAIIVDSNKDTSGIRNLTMGGNLVVTGNTKTTQLLVGDSTDTSSTRFISALDITMTSGSNKFITFGRNNGAGNQAEMKFTYNSPASNLNRFSMGFNSNNEILNLLYSGNVGIGTNAPSYKLDISGDVRITTNLNISGHNGTTTGLQLNGTLVTATATELNYVDTTVGTVEASKAIIVDSNKDTTGIRNLTATSVSATNLTGTLQTAAQTNVTSVGTLSSLTVSGNTNISGHNGTTTGLQLGGTLVTATAAELNILDGVTATATELNYVDTTAGTVEVSKAIIVDSNKDTTGIRNLTATSVSATNLTGTLQTAAQTNVTSVGTLSSLIVSGNTNISSHNGTTTGLQLGGTLVTATATELNILDGISATTAELNILDGVTATAAELNYVDTTLGTVEASKAVIVDSNKDTTGIRNLTATSVSATNLTGTLQTAAQTNVTSVGTLSSLTVSGNTNISSHNGTTTGLQLGGTLVTATAAELNILDGVIATAAELNYVDTTVGTVEASKAIIVDSNKDTTGIRNLTATSVSATNLTGTLQTAAQTNITSVGTLSSLTVSGNTNISGHNGTTTGLQLGGTLVTATATELNILDGITATTAQLNFNSGVTAGSASASKTIVLDSNRDIQNIRRLHLSNISIGTLDYTNTTRLISAVDNTITDGINRYLCLGKSYTTNNAAEWGYFHITDGSVLNRQEFGFMGVNGIFAITANRRVGINNTTPSTDLDVSGSGRITANLNISGHNGSTTGLQLSGTLVTATATELNILDGITASTTELNYVDTIAGTVEASKAVIVDANKDTTGIRNLTATNLTGTLQTAIQTNITSVGTLSSLTVSGDINLSGHNGSTTGLQLGGTLITATAPELNILDGVTATTAEINYLDITTIGTAEANKALVVDINKDISSIRNLTITGISKTLQLLVGDSTDSASERLISALDSTMGINTIKYITLGRTATNSNQAEIGFRYSGSGSSSNALIFGFFGGERMRLTAGGNFGINNNSPSFRLDVTGDARITTNLNISGHNGSTTGLQLGGTLITATATEINILDGITATTAELNYLDITTIGSAQASKALIVDSSRNIININALTATNLTGTLQTAAQTNITSVGTLSSLTISGNTNISGHNGSTTGLQLGGTLITATATEINILDGITATTAELNYLDITTIGSAQASKALIVDSSRNIININALTATNLTGTLQTAAQTNITSVGTLSSLTISGNANISGHNGSTTGLQLGGTLITATAAEINILDGITATTTELNYNAGIIAGIASASKTLVTDSNNDLSGIRNLTLSGNLTIAGTTTTINSTQVNIKDNILLLNSGPAGSGYDSGILTQRYQIANTSGTGDVVNDNSKENYSIVSATSNTITLSSEASSIENYYNNWWIKITSGIGNNEVRQISSYVGATRVATLSNSFVNTPVSTDTVNLYNKAFSTILWQESNKQFITAFTTNDTSANPLTIIDYANLTTNNLVATNLTGTLQTEAQTNITSVGTLSSLTVSGNTNISGHNGSSTGLQLGGILVTATAAELNILDGITATTSELNYLDITTIGNAEASKALIVDSNKDISSIRNLSATSVSATNLTGTLQTAAQTNITSVGTLSSLTVSGNTNISGHNGSSTGLQLGGILVTATAAELNILDGITATTAELNYLDITTIGNAEASKALIVDSNKDISSIRNLSATSVSATNLTGTIQTAAQTNITSVGTLSSLIVSGNTNISGHNESTTGLQLNGTLVTASATELNILDGVTATTAQLNFNAGTSAGTASASKTLVLNSSRNINNINGIGSRIGAFGTTQDFAIDYSVNANSLYIVNNSTVSLTDSAQSRGYDFYIQRTVDTIGASCGIALSVRTGTSELPTAGIRVIRAGANAGDGDLIFTTKSANHTEKMRITGSGNIGINNNSPTFRLDVSGDARITTNLNISGHNESTTGLQLNGTLVTASATELNLLDGVTATTTELNYVDTTVGVAEANKALVLDSSRNIININNISSTGIISNTITNDTTSLVNYQTWTNSATTPVTTILQMSNSLASIGTSSNHSFRILTNNTHAIWVTSNQLVGIGTNSPGVRLDVNGSCRVTDGLNVAGHNGTTVGLYLGGTLVTATAAELNYLDITTIGNAEASKALILDTNKDTSGIRNLSVTGNIGIGINTPSEKLEVSGTTKTSNLILDGTTISNLYNNQTYSNLPTTANWAHISWSPRLKYFIAFPKNSSPTQVAISYDGASYSLINTGLTSLTGINDLCWCNELNSYIIVGSSNSSIGGAISWNGTNTWTTFNFPMATNNILAVCWSPVLRMAIAIDNTYYYSSTSITGTWINNGAHSFTGVTNVSLIWNNNYNRFIAIFGGITNSTSVISYSNDGILWTKKNSPVQKNWTSITQSSLYSDMIIAVSSTATDGNNIIYSIDGGDGWNYIDNTITNVNFQKIIWIEEIAIFIAIGTNTQLYSRYGYTWSSFSLNNNNNWSCAAWAPELNTLSILSSNLTTITNGVFSTTHKPKSSIILFNNNLTLVDNTTSSKIIPGANIENRSALYGSHIWSNHTNNILTQELMRLNSRGYLGIRSGEPACPLTIHSDSYSRGIRIYTTSYNVTNNYCDLYLDSNANLNIFSSGNRTQIKSDLVIGNSTSSNTLRFRGVTGDDSTTFEHTVIAERLFGGSDKSELLLFKGNDLSGTSGPDRIRYRACEHRFQTYTTEETFANMQDNNTRLYIANNGNVGIGTDAPPYLLQVLGTARTTQLLVGTSTDTEATRLISALDNNMVAGNVRFLCLGRNNSAGNQAEIAFGYQGDNNNENYLMLGFFGIDVVRINKNGRMGIGTNPSVRLDVAGISGLTSTAYIRDPSGNVKTSWPGGWSGGLATWDIICASISYSGSLNSSSDLRLKKNIQNYTRGLNEILQLRSVSFKWKEPMNANDDYEYGFIAQEVESIIPEFILENTDGFKSIKQAFTPIFVNAIQDLNEKLETTETKVNELEQKNNLLETKIQVLENENTQLKLQIQNILERLTNLEN